jgi:CubicO group peptidase (beta-lactamase class C family)
MSGVVNIEGDVAAGFEPVREAFERNFTDHGEVGAACAVTVDGRVVVDLWAGVADPDTGQAWTRDTIVNVFSTTKGMAALCAHILADRGILDYDAPVTDYWDTFGKAGKDELPVRYLLTHQAGLPVIDEALPENASVDWDLMVEALERQAPVWTPGEKQGYHAVTFGWLVGEVVRRASGAASLGTFFASEVAGPLGIDFFIGTPATEDHRVARLVRDRQRVVPTSNDESVVTQAPPQDEDPQRAAMRERMRAMMSSDSITRRALSFASPPLAPSNNDPRWRRAEIPGANGHGNARALARVYGALARGGEIDGVRLLHPAAIRQAAHEQVQSPDEVLIMTTRRSLGFMLPVPGTPDRRGPNAFGHAGAGGSIGFADPDRGVGFGYTMNKMWSGGLMQPDPRAQSLVGAVNGCVDAS